MNAEATSLRRVRMTVPSLTSSLFWWKQMFGLEPTIELRGTEPPDARIQEAIGLSGAASSYAVLRAGDTMIELLEYDGPDGPDCALLNPEVTASRVELVLDDVQTQYEHMVAHGAAFPHPPIAIVREGIVFAYLTNPDGLRVELWQEP